MALIVSTAGVPREARTGDMYGWALGGGNEELTEEEATTKANWDRRRTKRQVAEHGELTRSTLTLGGRRLL